MNRLAPVRVAVLSDQSLLRDALAARLAEEDGLEVVAVLSGLPEDGDAMAGSPDVIVAHRSSAGPAVSASLRGSGGAAGRPRVLLLIDQEDEQLVVEGLRNGTSGFVSTHNSVEDLVAAIRGVADGETRIPPRLLPRVIEALQRGNREVDEASQRLALLTERERQILQLLADGRDRASIARELFISVNTVRTHVGHLLNKLGVDSHLRAVSLLLTARADGGASPGVERPVQL
jgi:DNA-binding NarL/FixJ family response regulator